MKWFKHYSDAHTDEVLCLLKDEFGLEGYGLWWVILERIAAQMDTTGKCAVTYSIDNWIRSCKISFKKFKKIIEFLVQSEKISIKIDDFSVDNFLSIEKKLKKNENFSNKNEKILKNGEEISKNGEKISKNNLLKRLTINCPKLLILRDEYTSKKNKKNSKNIGTLSGHCRDIVPQEEEKEEDINKEIIIGVVDNSNNFSVKDFLPKEEHKHLATILATNLNDELEKFKDWCLSYGKVYDDWDAAFRNWLRNSRKFKTKADYQIGMDQLSVIPSRNCASEGCKNEGVVSRGKWGNWYCKTHKAEAV